MDYYDESQRNQFLAGTAFADNQHRRCARGDLRDHGVQSRHLRADADQIRLFLDLLRKTLFCFSRACTRNADARLPAAAPATPVSS